LVYTDWSAGGARPAWLTEKHIIFFESNLNLIVEDIYGKVELLFSRKFSEELGNLINRLDQILVEKGSYWEEH